MSIDWTESDIPDQSGRVALITGANSGIGLEAARALAQHGAHVVLACRTRSKADEAAATIAASKPSGTTEILDLDLADLDSVEAAAKQFQSDHDRLDLLINNAGLMALPKQATAQGFEMQIGVNHLGHFALTAHLLPTVTSTADARIVNISSQGHRAGKIDFDDLDSEQKYSPWQAYFQSKLANLLFTSELQKRLEAAGSSTIAVAAHPGASATNLGNQNAGGVLTTVMHRFRPAFDKLLTQSAAMGALPTLRAAVDPDVSGNEYFGPDGFGEQKGHPVKVDRSKRAKDAATAARLWSISETKTGVTYSF